MRNRQHDVILDPPGQTTITGPSTAVNVGSLRIGASAGGLARLSMTAGGNITVINTVINRPPQPLPGPGNGRPNAKGGAAPPVPLGMKGAPGQGGATPAGTGPALPATTTTDRSIWLAQRASFRERAGAHNADTDHQTPGKIGHRA